MTLCTLCRGDTEVRPARFTLDTASIRRHGPAGGEYDLCQRCRVRAA